MGYPVPPEPPVEYGDNCGACWIAGKTPKYIIATVEGMTPKTPPPLGLCRDFCAGAGNGIYVMTQNPLIPCNWVYAGPVYFCAYESNMFGTHSDFFLIQNVMQLTHFSQTILGTCKILFDTNDAICCCDGGTVALTGTGL